MTDTEHTRRTRIYIDSPADRDHVILALTHNGYVVRDGREKVGNKWVKYIEFWKEN